MIGFFLLSLAQVDEPYGASASCEVTAPLRDPARCDPLYDDGAFEIYSIESVALGTLEQMQNLRQQTDNCEVSNRIDGVGTTVYVYDIVNANKESRSCVKKWILENIPELAFTEEKLDAYFPG